MTVIGYKGSVQDRWEHWQAMVAYKVGARELYNDVRTRGIAIEDKARYGRLVSSYKEAA